VNLNFNRSVLQFISAMAGLGLASLAVLGQTSSQNAAQPAARATAAQLTPYTAPDQSASVGVPAGWKVTKGAFGVIQMSGPNDEAISLGNGIFVKDGPYRPGQKANGMIEMLMPNQATIAQKYAMLWQHAAEVMGGPNPNVVVASAKAIALGNIAQCGIFLGSMTNAQGPQKFESRFCSLTPDTNGFYKLFWMNANIPANLAAQERATAEAVLSSYKISTDSLKVLLKPLTPPIPPPSAVQGGMSSGMWAERMADQSATCMDLGVIREEPEWKLPSYCH
jgi:hypothetical protein